MKLSISLPDAIASEIRALAKESNRSISYWLQRAWMESRTTLRNPGAEKEAEKKALSMLTKLQGSLKEDFSGVTSVDLQKQAFTVKKKK